MEIKTEIWYYYINVFLGGKKMKIDPRIVEIAPSVRAVLVENDSFKTSVISVSMLIPKGRDMGEILLLPKYLTYSSKKYPDPIELNARLEYLYGAVLDGTVAKFGESSLVEFGITCINNRYSLDGGDISAESLELLLDIIFEPDVDNGRLNKEKFELQRRLTVESVESEINNKRRYALTRMLETMCADEIFGITREETLEAIRAADVESAYKAWRRLLKEATIQINIIGSFDADKSVSMLKERFNNIERAPVKNETVFVEYAEDVTELTETMDINQSKLVLGYRSGMKDRSDDMYAVQTAVDIFGGGVYSRLFKTVREKLSLCYYCSASLIREKGLIAVQSGIEYENRQRAVDEISRQLEIMKNGEFTDEELEASKTAICDALSGALDTPDAIDAFLTRKITDDSIMPIEQSIENYRAVTRDDVIRAAKRITLDTVYTLAGKEGASDE